ncbi:relaxase/mobilization nuclease domain-containing protein [Roseateles sp. NT4]|uniref:relaxase/mobilization nuclease domain-containing protein n=1 Tax=Roseateles sp. NT4 TaxID=3453715 RepID=UPI003EF08134
MAKGVNIDGVLVTWGDRLFYPGNRMVKGAPPPKLTGDALRRHAAVIRSRIEATVIRRAPQAMVKVTGGGRGMRAVAAHFRYISKNGRLGIEDDRGETIKGAHAVRDLTDDWRYSGGLIPEEAADGGRREAFNVMLSMPRGTDPLAVERAAREFARIELTGHKYVMVLHDHQANPHVHISVRAEGRDGRRLNPRKADLHRWRETFAEQLRELGIDAEASRQTVRGINRRPQALWRVKALEEGRLVSKRVDTGSRGEPLDEQSEAWRTWRNLGLALARSSDPSDLRLAGAIERFVRSRGQAASRTQVNVEPTRHRSFESPRR